MPERDYESVAVSPDGLRAIVQVAERTTGLWRYGFSRNTLTPFMTSGESSQAPVWTADRRRVLFRGTRHGLPDIYWKGPSGADSCASSRLSPIARSTTWTSRSTGSTT